MPQFHIGLPPVAVSATDIAFIDFCYYAHEGQSVTNHLIHAIYFVASMVKLQYDWVCLATWMSLRDL
jgi:hypothetical protein